MLNPVTIENVPGDQFNHLVAMKQAVSYAVYTQNSKPYTGMLFISKPILVHAGWLELDKAYTKGVESSEIYTEVKQGFIELSGEDMLVIMLVQHDRMKPETYKSKLKSHYANTVQISSSQLVGTHNSPYAFKKGLKPDGAFPLTEFPYQIVDDPDNKQKAIMVIMGNKEMIGTKQ